MNIAGKSAANRRKFIRKYTLFKIAVYDADTKRFVGLVQDLSEGGMQLFGVKVDKNEARTLIVQASQYLKQGGIIRLEAICRWSRLETSRGYHLSGFEITSIADESKENLVKLIDFVTLG